MTTFVDKTGLQFGFWTVIKQGKNKPTTGKNAGRVTWLCKCICGTEREIVSHNLRPYGSTSCGCKKKINGSRRVIDVLGQKFHYLTVIKRLGRIHSKKRHIYWLCKCDCGNEIAVDGVSLRNHKTKSCGCRRAEVALANAKKLLSKEPRLFSAKQIWRKKSNPRTNYSDGDLTFEEFVNLTQLPCHYCGRSSQESNVCNSYKRKQTTRSALDNILDGEFRYNGLDRVDNSKPHNKNNVVPCCKYCNQAKMARGYNEFIAWIHQASSYLAQKETDSSKLESVSRLSVS